MGASLIDRAFPTNLETLVDEKKREEVHKVLEPQVTAEVISDCSAHVAQALTAPIGTPLQQRSCWV